MIYELTKTGLNSNLLDKGISNNPEMWKNNYKKYANV
jgi:hypothetical protein